MSSKRDFKEWIKWVSIIIIVDLTIFYATLALYHFLIFRKRLAREIERIRLENEKLERIQKGVPEPELLSPTQLSELLEADKTQKSDRLVVNKPKKKRKTVRKTSKTVEKVKEKSKMDKNPKSTAAPLLLPTEKTQDDIDPTVYNSPYAEQLLADPVSQKSENKTAHQLSESDETQSCSIYDEESVYSPKMAKPLEKTPFVVSPRPVAMSPRLTQPEQECNTARDDLWPN